MARGSYGLPKVGTDAVVELTPEAGGAMVTLKNSDYDLEIMNNVAEAPNTTDGMLRAAGLNDFKVTIKGSTDTKTTSTAIEAQAIPGGVFDFKVYRSKTPSVFWAGTMIVDSIKISTGTGSVESWDLSGAKAYGPLVFPNGVSF